MGSFIPPKLDFWVLHARAGFHLVYLPHWAATILRTSRADAFAKVRQLARMVTPPQLPLPRKFYAKWFPLLNTTTSSGV
ncbi:MAG: hypothetical protein RL630_676 [Verrucomicrobiota bacterium]|jgi:hypothetical protein